MSELFNLTGKTILITGSTHSLGSAMADACAAAGATVVVHGRNEDSAAMRAETLIKAGFKASHVAFDISDLTAVAAAIPTIVKRHGSIWGLINNAGMTLNNHLFQDNVEAYEKILRAHLITPFLLTQAAATEMKKNPGTDKGRILNIASTLISSPRVGFSNYASAKMAVVGFTRAVGADLGADGIRVNCIAPGPFTTENNRKTLNDPVLKSRFENRIPAARWGEPEELGGPAVFFMSPASSYVNSQTLFVDGGLTHFLQHWKT
ncbi:SDR family NAD(P)-dependent oxidoreductase [Bradyrhizobium zhanjiangense]|uniref:SDR family oxidoreductase n=1 Tax=Bradyrhizobium zhanjiangense TaxID=1325107 RepID=A0A4Q0SLI3_9BRAD|nr:SDR family oxidoreductase [Bradyrhizobium zhanjiangense]RXH40407.1 hypothetical protein XH94_13290 [Bradyrhizobium zhanjiangense]